ncbi:MAG: hypothetical protein U9Q97_03285 [Acidobacteriota bacterium]|nr:hypothetical protein [Acidobacteriota bacterium]
MTALKRRFFAYLDVMEDIGYDITAVQSIHSEQQLRNTINDLTPEMTGEIFYKSKWID